jgi:hypothetical protein
MLLVIASQAQDKRDQAYWDRYDEARLQIAKHQAARSVKVLEELHRTDSLDPNVSYLLGVALIITGKEPNRAVRLFETADSRFDELWDNPGVGPPDHLFYYMILAYCRTAQCDKARQSLNRLEAAFSSEEGFYSDDDYYLIDGRKWAGLCTEPIVRLLEVPDRLHRPDIRVKTQPHRFTTMSTLYGVQVAALLEPQLTRKFDGLKNIEVYVDMRGVYRYVIGNFSFRSQAEKLLEVVQAAGYPDAFVVNITDEERFPMEVVALDERSPKAQIRGEVDYSIQLAAYKESLPEESARFYLMVDSISEVSLDDLTLLTVGHYRSFGDAVMRRDELHRMGFRDAFIVAFNEGRKVPIEDARQYLRNISE